MVSPPAERRADQRGGALLPPKDRWTICFCQCRPYQFQVRFVATQKTGIASFEIAIATSWCASPRGRRSTDNLNRLRDLRWKNKHNNGGRKSKFQSTVARSRSRPVVERDKQRARGIRPRPAPRRQCARRPPSTRWRHPRHSLQAAPRRATTRRSGPLRGARRPASADELGGKDALIVRLGRIGGRLSSSPTAFEMRVIGRGAITAAGANGAGQGTAWINYPRC